MKKPDKRIFRGSRIPPLCLAASITGILFLSGCGTVDTPTSSSQDRISTASTQESTSSPDSLIGEAQATKIALEKTGGGQVVSLKLETDDGIREYDVEILQDQWDIDLSIHAYTGEILKYSKELQERVSSSTTNPTQSSFISAQEAEQIALGQAPTGSQITELELDEDDGIYEIELRAEGKEYNFDINAYTGSIISFQEDD